MEKWLPVVDFEGLYEVSNKGDVRSCERMCSVQSSTGSRHVRCYRAITLRVCFNNVGYPIVFLSKQGKKKARKVHVLVAQAFLGPCPNGFLVRHLDGNPKNNCIHNLAYGTPRENNLDKARHGTTRLSISDIAEIRSRIATGETHRSISKSFGVSRGLITHINMGRIYSHV